MNNFDLIFITVVVRHMFFTRATFWRKNVGYPRRIPQLFQAAIRLGKVEFRGPAHQDTVRCTGPALSGPTSSSGKHCTRVRYPVQEKYPPLNPSISNVDGNKTHKICFIIWRSQLRLLYDDENAKAADSARSLVTPNHLTAATHARSFSSRSLLLPNRHLPFLCDGCGCLRGGFGRSDVRDRLPACRRPFSSTSEGTVQPGAFQPRRWNQKC
jgi:hypothetical protein